MVKPILDAVATSLIPIHDANPTKRFPVVTIALIVANVLAFFLVEPNFGTGAPASEYFFENAPMPCQLENTCPAGFVITDNGISPPLNDRELDQVQQNPEVINREVGPHRVAVIPHRDLMSFVGAILLSTFLHAGFLHIAGNMLFLWVFGNNIEDFLGPIKYLGFYLLGGIAAALAHIFTHLNDIAPSVGASGAVAAVMGAYLVLFPRARVTTLVFIFFFITFIELSAFAVLGLWFVYQFITGAQEATGATSVAWMAHVGGFVFGVVGIFLLGGRPHRPRWEPSWGWRRGY
jgi:membrane associated rhomboid family serine protease